ncbi:hypothetical protein LINPERPRIM_LOCUS13536 [Linum perenne]
MEPFKDFIGNNTLIDLGFQGNPHTWTNYQDDENEIMSRIDRGLANQSWLMAFDKAIIFHEPIIGSDHAPLRVDLHYNVLQPDPHFRYDTRWLANPIPNQIIGNTWNTGTSTEENLTKCRTEIHRWAKKDS